MELIKFITKMIVYFLAIGLSGILVGLPLKLLWNGVLVDVLNIAEITYWQAVGIYAICAMLFKTVMTDSVNKKINEAFED